DLLEPSEAVRSLLISTKFGNRLSLTEADLQNLGEPGNQIKELMRRELLIPEDYDPLSRLIDQYVARPVQNPSLVYRSKAGEWILVRTSMEHMVYSRKRNELPLIMEEVLPSLVADIVLLADGTRTLREIFSTTRGSAANLLEDSEFRSAIDFLTSQKRQLIKFTSQLDDLNDPFAPVNTVPRNLYHSDRWNRALPDDQTGAIIDFHLHGIEEADWEFDLIEPTVNHCFRFPHEALGGLNYGSQFCRSTLRPEVVPLLEQARQLDVLEVGGGTGSFARAFMDQATRIAETGVDRTDINYHILDLSPALMENQKKILSQYLPESRHFQQDATEFDLPDHTFDLIIANEVIADFPIASVERSAENGSADPKGQGWQGDGVHYLDKYDLFVKDAPASFLLNAGAFRFLERAWKHLVPGGTLIVSEYGSERGYPVRSVHLNHDEFSIHFGHLAACATRIGFQCRMLTLKEFLKFDDELLVLNGREEHILCLNHVFKNYGLGLPFAIISKSEFDEKYRGIAEQIGLSGYSFSPLSKKYHFGPNIEDFLVLIMNKPQ
ncbi:MAG: hypothetical protein DMF69_18720, partial [Acidobacteria bacterium]